MKMDAEMSPFQIEILLHYYYSSAVDSPKLKLNTDMTKHTFKGFVEAGMLIEGPHPNNTFTEAKYHGNEKALKVYVEALMAIPLPVETWIIPKEI